MRSDQSEATIELSLSSNKVVNTLLVGGCKLTPGPSPGANQSPVLASSDQSELSSLR